jgi:hypothetical protein
LKVSRISGRRYQAGGGLRDFVLKSANRAARTAIFAFVDRGNFEKK